MSTNLAKWIFILGTVISGVILLALTVDTQRQMAALTHSDQLSPQVVAGKHAFERYNCNDCHTILGFGGYYAPDLTKVYKRIGADGIKTTVANPDVVFASSWRKMPQQHVKPEEIDELVAFFKWVSEIDNHDWPPQDRNAGISRTAMRAVVGGMNLGPALFKEKGCIGCHTIDGAGGSIGPVLDHVGAKMSAEQIEKFIKDPASVRPGAKMPAQKGLTKDEYHQLAKYLGGLK